MCPGPGIHRYLLHVHRAGHTEEFAKENLYMPSPLDTSFTIVPSPSQDPKTIRRQGPQVLWSGSQSPLLHDVGRALKLRKD